MRKILVAALALVLAGIGLVSTSISASAENGQHSARSCSSWTNQQVNVDRTVKTCAQVRWDTQNDGTGIVLEFLDVDTPEWCSSLTAYGEDAYKKANALMSDADQSPTPYQQWQWGVEPCNWNKDHSSIRGADVGPMDYEVFFCSGTRDTRLSFKWRLYSGGNSVLLHKKVDHNNGWCES